MNNLAFFFRALCFYVRGFFNFFRQCLPGYPGSFFASNIFDTVQAVFSGLTPDSRQLYNFTHFQSRDFLTDYELLVKSALINESYADLLDDRVVFYDYMAPYVHMPRLLGYIRQGKIYPGLLSNTSSECQTEVSNFFKGLLYREPAAIIKPSRPGQRDKFFWITSSPESKLMLDGSPVTDQQLRKKLTKLEAHLITEPVDQADYAKDIFPYAINSVKILTMIDPQNNEPFAAGAYHCFGTRASSPTDSLERGGCWAGIDPAKGLLTKAFVIMDGELVEISKHPDTKKQLQSAPIPFFAQMQFELLKQHRRINYIKMINWTVVMLNNGFVLLSADSVPDLRALQVISPLLQNSRVFNFFRHYEIIKRG